ncbi:hypothetical protein VB715_03125 [Crocosphaera sp. UHCC 0190]|uniref:hypothetical protein n=1 Tax=Crocosphaera sp. UHCC 0190 TaxID=3110246 RepID=UPI002B1EA6BB|nr:hypothetical protein [Crocosphaera sp. UHCC 0190]MEA5508749.1 hypothetical protein [Crocosphaera sp. UHCC 0190]
MNQSAWPFLVSRNLYLDYRTIVAPDFMSQTKISNLLARATDGDLTPQNTAILRKIIGSHFGDFIVIFRIVKATKSDIKQGDIEEILKDPFGREIYLIEGLVIKDNLNNDQFNLDIFDKSNQILKEGYCQFWQQIEPCPAIPSQPFKIQKVDVNKPIFTLQNTDPFIIKNKPQHEYSFLQKYELNNPKKIITS